ncbi:hypothetical protein NDU88_003577 [Pleurodeles waltl]|uniref:C3H1-type domain-containing protein n=1 Tax=Pleurodeles waltl TaxID=8319 RepID=A0AAV7QD87_PLEWA|nr:hypothetical protein NDU88_003577 [Pleurodeles waltl]
MAAPAQAMVAQKPAKSSAEASTPVASSSSQSAANSGTHRLSPLLDLGVIRSEHEHLRLHVPMEIKEKIWKGTYIVIFDLLVANRRERFNDQGAQLACYQNRIVGAHDEYGDIDWKDYDREFRWIKEYKPDLGWDQIDIIAWLQFTNRPYGNGLLPFRASSGATTGPPGGSSARKWASWDFNRRSCTRPAGTCRFKHCCSFYGQSSHLESNCLKKSKDRGNKKQD